MRLSKQNKNNHIHTYININSNNPRSMIKEIPNAINLRINKLTLFRKINKLIMKPCFIAVSVRNEYLILKKVNTIERDNTLNKSNSSKNNNYGKGENDNNNKHNENNDCRNRKRKIIWFNPPF